MFDPKPKLDGKWRTIWCSPCARPWCANKWACECQRLWSTCAKHFRWGSGEAQSGGKVSNSASTPSCRQIAPLLSRYGKRNSSQTIVTSTGVATQAPKRRKTAIVTICEPTPTDAVRECEPELRRRATLCRSHAEFNTDTTRPRPRKKRKKCW